MVSQIHESDSRITHEPVVALAAHDVRKSYRVGQHDVEILHGASLTVHTGHHAAILAGCNFFDQRMAHAAVDSLYHNIRHFLFPFKKGPQQVATGRSA